MSGDKAELVPICLWLFGQARALTGVTEKYVEVPRKMSGRQLREFIFHEIFKELTHLEMCCMLALNEEYIDVDSDTPLTISAHSEVGVIPPICGG